MIWFIADLHLGHANILKHQIQRLVHFGENLDAMDAHIISCINNQVLPNDTLWILGDFCWKASKAGHYRNRIKCREIHVVTGNHDSSSLRNHVSSMQDMAYKKFGEQKIHLTHYPMVSWRGRNHGSIHLYGHCHGTMEQQLNELWPDRKAMDVGFDVAWRPFSLNEILQRFVCQHQ